MIIFTILVILIVLYLLFGFKVITQYERGVVLRFGRVQPKVRGPGITYILPLVDQIRKISMRIVTLPVDSQKIITKDNVSIDVAAVAYYQVDDPIKSVVAIENVVSATYQIAQTTVRNIIGKSLLDEVLSDTSALNDAIKAVLDKATEPWGIYVSTVALKDIQLPNSMQSAMAAAPQAEREKRAKIIAAEGEQLSAAKLAEAAEIIAKHPIALQLRNLQVLTEIASDKNSTIVFPAQFMDSIASVKAFMSKDLK